MNSFNSCLVSVFLNRSRSVVRVGISVNFEPSKVNVFNKDCVRAGREVSCMLATVCLNVTAQTPMSDPKTVGTWRLSITDRSVSDVCLSSAILSLSSALRYSCGFEENRYFPRAVFDSTDLQQPTDITIHPDTEHCQRVYFHIHVSFEMYHLFHDIFNSDKYVLRAAVDLQSVFTVYKCWNVSVCVRTGSDGLHAAADFHCECWTAERGGGSCAGWWLAHKPDVRGQTEKQITFSFIFLDLVFSHVIYFSIDQCRSLSLSLRLASILEWLWWRRSVFSKPRPAKQLRLIRSQVCPQTHARVHTRIDAHTHSLSLCLRQFCGRQERLGWPLCARQRLRSSSERVIEANRRKVLLEAHLENRGENAYDTVLHVTHSPNLLFSSLVLKVCL